MALFLKEFYYFDKAPNRLKGLFDVELPIPWLIRVLSVGGILLST